ncbi:MAG TPA: hypothetical protein VKR42_04540 [Ktedonobacteraceae bacterium]|nr:hypothetical protein [Ktedonobacteraceae bacterium]
MGASAARKLVPSDDFEVADDDEMYETRSHTSAIRYKPRAKPVEHDSLEDLNVQKQQGTLIQRRSASTRSRTATDTGTDNGVASKAISIPLKAPKRQIKLVKGRKIGLLPVLAIFAGMLATIVLANGLMTFGSWWQIHQDDVTYGRPRTYQFNAVVGHNDSAANPTHFICINLNRHVEIIEFPGGDATHARMYQGPVLFGDGQDLTPVTAEVRDVNGDGKPDLIVHIQDQQIVFINTGTQFRPLNPGEQVNLGS